MPSADGPLPGFVTERRGIPHLRVRVRTRSAHEGIDGVAGDSLVVRVTAPPAEGRANAAACKVVARACGVPPTRVSVARGARAAQKLLRVEGIPTADLAERLR